MNKEEIRRLICPYGLVIIPRKEAVAVFNRHYMPIGALNQVGNIPDPRRYSWFLDVTKAQDIEVDNIPQELLNASWNNYISIHNYDDSPFNNCTSLHLFFYNDGCIPTLGKSCLQDYLRRVHIAATFLNLEVLDTMVKPLIPKSRRWG